MRQRLLEARRNRVVGSVARDAAAAARPDGTAASVARRVFRLPEVADARCVAAYVGLRGEPDTSVLLKTLLDNGVRVLLPALRPDLDLDFREFTGVLVPGALGTVEPPPAGEVVALTSADAVVVPAVAVDLAGRRLGRGGGSYDRALARLDPRVPVIAIVQDRELLDDVPTEPHDRPVAVVVTPRRTWRCVPT